MARKRVPERRPDFVVLGYVERPHGVHGSLRVRALTDRPEQFRSLRQVYLVNARGVREPFTVERAKVEGNRVYLKLEEIRDRDQAEEWRGAEVEIAGECLPPVEEGEYYTFELLGLTVETTEGETIGVIEDVLDMPANDVYVVRSEEKEVLIPAIKEVIKEIDLSGGRIVIEVIEGLLD